MSVFRAEITPRRAEGDRRLVTQLQQAGLRELSGVVASRLFFLEGDLSRADADAAAARLLVDPVVETVHLAGNADELPAAPPGTVAVEVHLRPGVMDPVAESTLVELRAEGLAISAVRSARRYLLAGPIRAAAALETVRRVLANDCIEEIVPGTAGVRPSRQPPEYEFHVRHVPLRHVDAPALERLSRAAHLFLSLDELQAIQRHYQDLGREPTDLELETLAQTWSEHCVHKTLRSAVRYEGAPLPRPDGSTPDGEETREYANLLRDTIVRATETLIAAGRGPQCLSVFKDNAGVVAFDADYGVAFKVETHNHPSAIEPYGGAATGIGGVIRDVIGCGLGARPVANTDVFCVGPADWPHDRLPQGVLHPARVLRGVVHGVADYGNRMGIPTVNGAVIFDPRYLGNPLVYCGCVGLLPRALVEKQARPGDHVVLIGGRTGRDGIHGATFSSAELTDTHADEFSHAVQIGNAITEKRFLDAVLRARDAEGGCLYHAITDCGAGGLSSAVGEMAEHVGAVVELDRVPLKYPGLRYDEIWISEAQERMVLAVPPANLERFLRIMAEEEVEATVIGTFGHDGAVAGGVPGGPVATGEPRLELRYRGQIVGELDLAFLHHGLPRLVRTAHWQPDAEADALHTLISSAAQPERSASCSTERPAGQSPSGSAACRPACDDSAARLLDELRRPVIASKAWIIRQYDHEVQGGSVVKPLLGPGGGPGDAAVLRPRLGSPRGIALGCGLAPHLADIDPYWMAVASIDEAIRNVVSVGADPAQVALLDNFCWGRADDPRQLGGLARACQACHDAALAYGTPFISGKDSLNNEFALDEADVEPLLETLRALAAGTGFEAARLRALLPGLESRVRARRRLAIPSTLLISALGVLEDVSRCLTPDLKAPGHTVLLVGGLPLRGFALADAARVHSALAGLMRRGQVTACHDVSDGGWLTSLAEMAIAGRRGARISAAALHAAQPWAERCAAYVVETPAPDVAAGLLADAGVMGVPLAVVTDESRLELEGATVGLDELQRAWAGA